MFKIGDKVMINVDYSVITYIDEHRSIAHNLKYDIREISDISPQNEPRAFAIEYRGHNYWFGEDELIDLDSQDNNEINYYDLDTVSAITNKLEDLLNLADENSKKIEDVLSYFTSWLCGLEEGLKGEITKDE